MSPFVHVFVLCGTVEYRPVQTHVETSAVHFRKKMKKDERLCLTEVHTGADCGNKGLLIGRAPFYAPATKTLADATADADKQNDQKEPHDKRPPRLLVYTFSL